MKTSILYAANALATTLPMSSLAAPVESDTNGGIDKGHFGYLPAIGMGG